MKETAWLEWVMMHKDQLEAGATIVKLLGGVGTICFSLWKFGRRFYAWLRIRSAFVKGMVYTAPVIITPLIGLFLGLPNWVSFSLTVCITTLVIYWPFFSRNGQIAAYLTETKVQEGTTIEIPVTSEDTHVNGEHQIQYSTVPLNSLQDLPFQKSHPTSTRWDPSSSEMKSQPQIFPIHLKDRKFASIRTNVTVVNDCFKFIFKMMTERGEPNGRHGLFSPIDEVALDFRFYPGTLTLNIKEHKSSFSQTINTPTPTRFSLAVTVLQTTQHDEYLLINVGGDVLPPYPIPRFHRSKIALITWNEGHPYDMCFDQIKVRSTTR